MKKDQIILLEDRGLISITGEDNKNFLQNIITNDVEKVSLSSTIFSGLFTRGRGIPSISPTFGTNFGSMLDPLGIILVPRPMHSPSAHLICLPLPSPIYQILPFPLPKHGSQIRRCWLFPCFPPRVTPRIQPSPLPPRLLPYLTGLVAKWFHSSEMRGLLARMLSLQTQQRVVSNAKGPRDNSINSPFWCVARSCDPTWRRSRNWKGSWVLWPGPGQVDQKNLQGGANQ